MRIAAVIVALAAIGCVSRQPQLARTAVPSPTSGYVAALSSKDVHGGFGLGICDAKQHDYVFSLGETSPTGDAIGIIPLPPGTYHLCYWVTWYVGGQEEAKQVIAADSPVAALFTVAPGHVSLLGRWYATRDGLIGTITKRLRFVPIEEADAVAAIRTAYHGFASAVVDCAFCNLPVREVDLDAVVRD